MTTHADQFGRQIIERSRVSRLLRILPRRLDHGRHPEPIDPPCVARRDSRLPRRNCAMTLQNGSLTRLINRQKGTDYHSNIGERAGSAPLPHCASFCTVVASLGGRDTWPRRHSSARGL